MGSAEEAWNDLLVELDLPCTGVRPPVRLGTVRRVASLRPYRVDGVPPVSEHVVRQLEIGEPCEVVVSLNSDDTIDVTEPEVVWQGHFPMMLRRRDGRVVINVTQDPNEAARALRDAIDSVGTRRRRRFRTCRACNQPTPPEHWHGEGHCQGCATSQLGVVY